MPRGDLETVEYEMAYSIERSSQNRDVKLLNVFALLSQTMHIWQIRVCCQPSKFGLSDIWGDDAHRSLIRGKSGEGRETDLASIYNCDRSNQSCRSQFVPHFELFEMQSNYDGGQEENS